MQSTCKHYTLLAALITSVLALSVRLQANVVYTPVNVTVSGNGIIKIDLNHDGKVDMSIVASGRSTLCTTGRGSTGSVYGMPSSGAGAQ